MCGGRNETFLQRACLRINNEWPRMVCVVACCSLASGKVDGMNVISTLIMSIALVTITFALANRLEALEAFHVETVVQCPSHSTDSTGE